MKHDTHFIFTLTEMGDVNRLVYSELAVNFILKDS